MASLGHNALALEQTVFVLYQILYKNIQHESVIISIVARFPSSATSNMQEFKGLFIDHGAVIAILYPKC